MGSFFEKINYLVAIIVFLVIFISCFFTPFISSGVGLDYDLNVIENMEISSSGFMWPIPGYTKITSYFGKRQSPTQGASSYHKGIDIGAPEGTKLISVIDGQITYTGFLGGGGYTITLSKDNMKITYCHVSPTYIVEEGQEVIQGQVIGFVGPKNVYGVARKSI